MIVENFLGQKSFLLVAVHRSQVKKFLLTSNKIHVILQTGAEAENIGERPALRRPQRVPLQVLLHYKQSQKHWVPGVLLEPLGKKAPSCLQNFQCKV